MGSKYSPETAMSGQEVQLPVHLICSSHPKYSRSTKIPIMYGKDTNLYDILKKIELYISNNLSESSLDLEIGAVSKKSFMSKKVVFHCNSYQSQSVLKSQMKSELITNYSRLDIAKKGIHIQLKIAGDSDYTFDEEADTESNNIISNELRKPLQQLSVNNNNIKNISNTHQKKSQKICEPSLAERINELCRTSDVAYENFDEIMFNYRKKETLLHLSTDADYISNKQTKITWHMRAILMDWLYDLQIDIGLNNETLFASINYIDLYLSKCSLSRQHLQLLGVTSIMIASKTYEIIPQSINEWIYLSHDQYSTKQMKGLEKKLLNLINWDVFQVTPYNYIQPWLEVLDIAHNSNEKLIIDLLIKAVSLNKLFLEIKLSKLIASVFYLTKIYLSQRSKISLTLLSSVSKYNVTESKSINNVILVQLHQILLNLIAKKEKNSMTSAIYRIFTDKEYISRTYGKDTKLIDIDSFPFNDNFEKRNI